MANKERTTVTLSAQVKDELEKMIPKNTRSQFVEQAIVEALKIRHQQELSSLIDKIEPVSIDQDSAELVINLRQAGSSRLLPG